MLRSELCLLQGWFRASDVESNDSRAPFCEALRNPTLWARMSLLIEPITFVFRFFKKFL